MKLSVVIPVCNEAENVAAARARNPGRARGAPAVRDHFRRRRQHRRHRGRGRAPRATAGFPRFACCSIRGAAARARRSGPACAPRAPTGSRRSMATVRTIRPTFPMLLEALRTGRRSAASHHGQSHDAQGHLAAQSVFAGRQCRTGPAAARWHAGHGLRHQAPAPGDVSRAAALQSHAPLPAGAVPESRREGRSRFRCVIGRARAALRNTGCTIACGSASSTCSACAG